MPTPAPTPRRRLHLGGAFALVLALCAGAAATVATADTGATNVIKVIPATTTIAPVGSGGSFTVEVAANGGEAISGAGAGLTFDPLKLQLTAVAKDTTIVANGASYAGFPTAAVLATFLANANTSGSIPVIAWSYFDGTSAEAANTDHAIFSATFSVIATGDSTLGVVIGASGGILGGTAADYGQSLVATTVDGHVVNSMTTTTTTTTTTTSEPTTTTTDVTTSTTMTQPTTTSATTTSATSTVTSTTTDATTTTETTTTGTTGDGEGGDGPRSLAWIGGAAGHPGRTLKIHALVFAAEGSRPETAEAVIHFAGGDVRMTLHRMGRGIAYQGDVPVPDGQPGGAIAMDLSATVGTIGVSAHGTTTVVVTGKGGR